MLWTFVLGWNQVDVTDFVNCSFVNYCFALGEKLGWHPHAVYEAEPALGEKLGWHPL